MNDIAVIITCHNRKEKTIACISALYQCRLHQNLNLEVFLVDDGSTDATAEALAEQFPRLHILHGDGNLFWAGGMRFAWNEALKHRFDAYLLLNDDTLLFPSILDEMRVTHAFALSRHHRAGLYIGSTRHPLSGQHTYGGTLLNDLCFPTKLTAVIPNGQEPQFCHLGNANIMMVPKEVVDEIGIFSAHFTHGIADYDYTLRAVRKKIPVLVCSEYCGTCTDDHGKNWLGNDHGLLQRIAWMKSVKGLAYKEYLHFIRCHFPLYYPVAWMKLWMKTLFPSLWDRFK